MTLAFTFIHNTIGWGISVDVMRVGEMRLDAFWLVCLFCCFVLFVMLRGGLFHVIFVRERST